MGFRGHFFICFGFEVLSGGEVGALLICLWFLSYLAKNTASSRICQKKHCVCLHVTPKLYKCM